MYAVEKFQTLHCYE